MFGVLAGEQHQNTMGGVHGGLLLAMVDTALGNFVKTIIGEGVVAVTIDLNMSFLFGARPGQWIEVHPVLERKGQTMALTSTDVLVDGSKIARASATFCLHHRNRDEMEDRHG